LVFGSGDVGSGTGRGSVCLLRVVYQVALEQHCTGLFGLRSTSLG
jgi:hypothetical protein